MIDTHCGDAMPPNLGGELVFRVRGPDRQGQIVRLRSPKCTVGSGPQCTLRLRARGVRAVHCLIIRGQAATLVRRWAPDTWLNGQAFLDQALAPGDLLRLGPVDLEVLSLGSPRGAEAGQSEAHCASRPVATEPPLVHPGGLSDGAEQLEAQRGAPATEAERLDAERAALAAERAAIAAEAKRLEETAAELEARRAQLKTERASWDAQRAETDAQLAQRAELLDQRARQLDKLRDELDRQRRMWETEETARVRQLEQRAEQLDARQQELDQRAKQLNEAEHLIDQRAAQLDARQQELDQLAERLESQRQELQSREAALAEPPLLRPLAGDAAASQLRASSAREPIAGSQPAAVPQVPVAAGKRPAGTPPIAQQTSDNASAADTSAQGQALIFEQPAERAPIELAAVLRRMGTAPLVLDDGLDDGPDDQPDSLLTSASEAEVFPSPGRGAHAAGACAHDSNSTVFDESATGGAADPLGTTFGQQPTGQVPATGRGLPAGELTETDEGGEPQTSDGEPAESHSIDIYMAGLLQRARGWTSGSSDPPDGVTYNGGADSARAGQPPQGWASWGSRIKRRQGDAARPGAPESDAGLSAMRQLASQAARAAILSHARRQTNRARWTKLAVALTGLGLGLVLLTMWQRGAAGAVSYYGGLVGLLVALVWGLQYAVLSGRLIVNRFGSLELNRPEPATAQPAESGLADQGPAEAPAAQDAAVPDASQ